MRRLAAAALVATASFAVTGTAHADLHVSTQAITIPATDTQGNASPFPAVIPGGGVHAEPGLITDVDLSLYRVNHTNPDDLEIVLVSPGGTKVLLMSDACGTADVEEDRYWNFDDEAPADVSDAGACNLAMAFRPEGYEPGDPYPEQVGTPDGDELSLFDGENPNGRWRLYVMDDAAGGTGAIEGGFSIAIATGSSEIQIAGGPAATGLAAPYPAMEEVAGGGIVTDVDVLLDGVTHANPADLDILLQGPQGQRALLLANRCEGTEIVDRDWDVDDEAPASFPGGSLCDSGTYRPSAGPGDHALAAPAPAGPHGSSLAAFDLTPADGQWKLWIEDDDPETDEGFVIGGYSLQLRTRPRSPVTFETAVNAVEGSFVRLLVFRGGPPPLGVGAVRVRSADGTAQAGSDYTAVDQVVTFGPNEALQVVEVPVADDGAFEPLETFTATLSDATGDAAVGSPATTTVTVGGTEQPPVSPFVLPQVPPFDAADATTLPANPRCRRRGSRLRLQAKGPPGVPIVRTEFLVNGRRAGTLVGAQADDPFFVRVRRARTRVVVRVHALDGRVVERARTFRRCKARRRRG